jgi:hypothetical protein
LEEHTTSIFRFDEVAKQLAGGKHFAQAMDLCVQNYFQYKQWLLP